MEVGHLEVAALKCGLIAVVAATQEPTGGHQQRRKRFPFAVIAARRAAVSEVEKDSSSSRG